MRIRRSPVSTLLTFGLLVGLPAPTGVLWSQTDTGAKGDNPDGAIAADRKAGTADEKWESLAQVSRTQGAEPVGNRVRWRALADEARFFYLEHSEHPRAAAARSLEVLTLVDLAETGDETVKPG